MASITQLRKTPQGADADLKVNHDDFSVQVEAESDPMFWVRVEQSIDDVVRVSDLKRASLTYERVAAALELAIRKATGHSMPRALLFLDIAPSSMEAEATRERVEQEAAHLGKIVVMFCGFAGLRISRVEQLRRGSKSDLLFDVEIQN